ncbi:MAG: nickel insertion protein [Promethearchaeota archaeon]
MITVDTVSGEVIPYLIESAIERGASNMHVVPAMTKKGRPEYLLFVDVEESNLESVIGFLLAELGSLGYRVIRDEHVPSDYVVDKVEIDLSVLGIAINHVVQIKVIKRHDGSILTANLEYEDLRYLTDLLNGEAVKIPMMKLKSMIEGRYLERALGQVSESLQHEDGGSP